ncbi:MAG TPA: FAD-dependent monooxygenase [Pseudonocardiaceae bacterium]|jgi:2-polyprenyl-6-methoxyphenol hydroxylase-like FAD-dependent oxidoreductase|nr:FAD-dependent monooxygenase [Pseudonocardiaceae bacterium]
MSGSHALVLGAGIAGLLAGAAIAPQVEAVTVVDRDRLPDGPAPRKGVPQANHVHALLSGGARAIESLLPGTLDRLWAAGAHRIAMPTQLVTLTAQGWWRRFPEMQFLVGCSRNLLDWTIRDQLLGDRRVTLIPATEVRGLTGGADRVTGARVRDRDTGEERTIDADVVIDATGRTSKSTEWLAALGLPAVPEELVDPGLAYVSRMFQAPTGVADGFPHVTVQAVPGTGKPGVGGALMPIEEGRWLITLAGTRGAEPPADAARFEPYARDLRHPLIADLIRTASPAGPPHGFRSTTNRRRRFERMPRWPQGLLILGDALCTFNPVYGHGMSVAAQSAVALRDELREHELGPEAIGRTQRAVAGIVDAAWMMATGQDARYPQTIGGRSAPLASLFQRYVDRLMRTAASRPAVTDAILAAFTLSGSFNRLLGPDLVLATLRGPADPPLDGPPLTADELAKLGAGWS